MKLKHSESVPDEMSDYKSESLCYCSNSLHSYMYMHVYILVAVIESWTVHYHLSLSIGREGLQPPPVPRTKTSPAAVRPPTIKPRSTTDSVIIKNIPAGKNEDTVLLYLQLLCGVKCSVSKKKDKGVIIKFANKIGTKKL